MLDKLLSIGCTLDWITPTTAFIRDFLSSPVRDFGIPANSYWSRKEIRRFLKYYGIDVWGLMYNFDGNILMFTVRKQQASLVYYLLQREGIPLLYGSSDDKNSFAQLELDDFDTFQHEQFYTYFENPDVG